MPTVPLPLVGPDYADETASFGAEEWRAIPGYEGYYEASSLGRIRSLFRIIERNNGWPLKVRERILRQKVMCGRYWGVSLLREGKQTTYLVHRLVALAFFGAQCHIDHIDRNGSNNVLTNLRPATRSQNLGNMRRHKDNTSGYKGVTWDKKAMKWQARICVERKYKFLGYFNDLEEAAKAYDLAARVGFGQFANPNCGAS